MWKIWLKLQDKISYQFSPNLHLCSNKKPFCQLVYFSNMLLQIAWSWKLICKYLVHLRWSEAKVLVLSCSKCSIFFYLFLIEFRFWWWFQPSEFFKSTEFTSITSALVVELKISERYSFLFHFSSGNHFITCWVFSIKKNYG